MRVRNLGVAAVVAVAIAGVTSGSAQASGYDPEPWQPYRTTGFEAPAGRYCSFALRAEPIADEEEYRITDRYDDGTPRLYEYRGKLVDRFTNVSTGKSVVRDLSGHAWHEVRPDGATWKSFTVVGPFSAGFRAEDPYPQGYYRFDGLHSITFDADGTRHMAVDAGPEENLCETLA